MTGGRRTGNRQKFEWYINDGVYDRGFVGVSTGNLSWIKSFIITTGISGCIDGYSRRIIFLKVSFSNYDPSLIAGHYMESVEQLGGCPRMVWTDCGTEMVF